MNSTVALLAAIVVLAIIAVLFLRKKNASESDADKPEGGKVQGDQALYALGMNQLADALALNACIVGNDVKVFNASVQDGLNKGLGNAAVDETRNHDSLSLVDHFHRLVDRNYFIFHVTIPFLKNHRSN